MAILRVLLLSGGIDSTSLAFLEGTDTAFLVDYGQPSFRGELRAARSVAKLLDFPLKVKTLPLYKESGVDGGYWPYRNQMLITLAAMTFHKFDDLVITIGSLADDIYDDCKPNFFEKINTLFESQGGNVTVRAPALNLDALGLLKRANLPEDWLNITFSCHLSSIPCGTCPGCVKHQKMSLFRKA